LQNRWNSGKGRLPGEAGGPAPGVSLERRPLIFGALVIFFGLYYYRPEDLIRVLAYIPMARISGGLAFLALLAGMMSGAKVKVPRAVKILWLLLLQMTICIPVSMWPGGSFKTVFDKFAKGVVVAMLISMVVVNLRELRKLLWIQASAVALVTFFSIILRNYGQDGRLSGIQESILSNPNDLAINIAISFPLALAFMLHARGFRKVVWILALAFMAIGVVLTASRSGLLALIIIIAICVWEYGIKGKRRHVVVVTIVALVVGFGIAVSSARYRARVESIFMGNVEGSGDKGSLEARKDLLKKSVMVALTHPVFGVGPGCFILVDEGWHVAHNAYTELAAESGIPALVLFLMAMGAAFKNISLLRKSKQYQNDPEFTLFTQALWAGLVGYMVGSMFASTEYNLYPYFVIGYTCAMVRITGQQPLPEDDPGKKQGNKRKILSKATYDGILKPQALRSR
jgi:O-antigen ligase